MEEDKDFIEKLKEIDQRHRNGTACDSNEIESALQQRGKQIHSITDQVKELERQLELLEGKNKNGKTI